MNGQSGEGGEEVYIQYMRTIASPRRDKILRNTGILN